jgi:hypothetical protein
LSIYDLFADPEVADLQQKPEAYFDVSFFVEQDVVQLDVAMHDAF